MAVYNEIAAGIPRDMASCMRILLNMSVVTIFFQTLLARHYSSHRRARTVSKSELNTIQSRS